MVVYLLMLSLVRLKADILELYPSGMNYIQRRIDRKFENCKKTAKIGCDYNLRP